MNGLSSAFGRRETPVGQHVVGGKSPSPRQIAPWAFRKEAWTPWNWDETLDQYQTFRKTKSQI